MTTREIMKRLDKLVDAMDGKSYYCSAFDMPNISFLPMHVHGTLDKYINKDNAYLMRCANALWKEVQKGKK